MTWAVIATGPSLRLEDVDYLRGKVDGVIAVSNAGLDICPWANALVSHDSGWWISHPEAREFKGKKFSALAYSGTIGFSPKKYGFTAINSGLLAMYVARDYYNAKKIILLGFDMNRDKGQHYFGKHERQYNGKCLLNTDERRFNIHIKQFDKFSGCEVINCTPQSSLKKFPIQDLRVSI